jgi:beta-lactamase class A
MRILALGFATLLFESLCFANAETNPDDSAKFAQLEKRHAGSRIGVSAIDPERNKRIDYRADERFLMCSTFKVLAVAAELKRVDEKTEWLDRFAPYEEDDLLEYSPVTRPNVEEGGMFVEGLCAAAIEQSDNTAANLILSWIDGPEGLTKFARTLGDEVTRLDRWEPALNVASPGDERDTTTPAAMCQTLQRLFTSDALTQESRKRLEGWMVASKTGAKMIRASVPAGWKIGDKTGRSGKGETNDIAILRPPTGGPIFIAIYTDAPKESSEGREKLIAEIAKTAIEALRK